MRPKKEKYVLDQSHISICTNSGCIDNPCSDGCEHDIREYSNSTAQQIADGMSQAPTFIHVQLFCP